jgi:hypothetical protein
MKLYCKVRWSLIMRRKMMNKIMEQKSKITSLIGLIALVINEIK